MNTRNEANEGVNTFYLVRYFAQPSKKLILYSEKSTSTQKFPILNGVISIMFMIRLASHQNLRKKWQK
jgi:hypothetical protein